MLMFGAKNKMELLGQERWFMHLHQDKKEVRV